MILNNRFEEPYNKFPGDGPIQLLSKPIVKSKLSKKFWLYSQYLESQNLINNEEEIFNDNNEEEYSNNYINNEQSIKIKYYIKYFYLTKIFNNLFQLRNSFFQFHFFIYLIINNKILPI